MSLQQKGFYLSKSPDIDLTALLYFETGDDVLLVENASVAWGMQSRVSIKAEPTALGGSDARGKEGEL